MENKKMKVTKIAVKKDQGFTFLELERQQKSIYPSLYTVGLVVSSIINGEDSHPLAEIGGKENYKLYLEVCGMIKPQFCKYFYESIKNGFFKREDLESLEKGDQQCLKK